MLRALFWRVLALAGALLVVGFSLSLLRGYAGEALRGGAAPASRPSRRGVPHPGLHLRDPIGSPPPQLIVACAALALTAAVIALAATLARLRARARREYVRLRVVAYRGDTTESPALARALAALTTTVSVRWSQRLLQGQPSVSLEVHHERDPVSGASEAWLAVACERRSRARVQSALRSAYPNLRLLESAEVPEVGPALTRLRKRHGFISRIWTGDPRSREREPEPTANRLLTAMGAVGERALVQIAITPAPVAFERLARRLYLDREARISRERHEHELIRDRSMVRDAELRGGLDVQHAALVFADIRVAAETLVGCEEIAAVLRTERAENRLVERRAGWGGRLPRSYAGRIARGEGNPIPNASRGVFAPRELAELWQLPSVDYTTVPFARGALPVAPAPPGVLRPRSGRGTLRDAHGPLSIHESLRRQNTAVPGTVDQGKSSFLVASVAEDLMRERCAVIVLDPKGDAAEAALSAVPRGRTCTLLDFADPTCGFNPLAVDAPADVIADYAVAALKSLFTDADIRASSDRYLRNAIIAVLAADRGATLWDAARLLSVGEEGYAYRRAIGAKVRALPELKEISSFFTVELSAQLADARSATTAKLDAPVNKLARLLNSPSIKRVLLNDSLLVDFDRLIERAEVLVVQGALGSMGAGNTSVLMQLLVGMLDASLARQQDRVRAEDRTAVALKIDEAPLVLNRGFAETMALKRSAGLETVACWQTDSQWVEREIRDQLDALFAHRVYFATASAEDARAAVDLTMAEFSDSVRPGLGRLSTLGRPDLRLRLPRHHAVVSWVTREGRQPAFVAETIPMRVDRERLEELELAQAERGGRRLLDMRQPHWEQPPRSAATTAPRGPQEHDAPAATSRARAREAEVCAACGPPPLPPQPAESYRELLDLDRARAARHARPAPVEPGFEPERADLAVLSLLAALGRLSSTQIHRRVNAGRAISTTQRRLKRLADAGLIGRLQFHRPDGGGVPMCCSLTPAGLWLLEAREESAPHALPTPPAERPGLTRERDLRAIRRELHLAGWALALAEVAGGGEVRGSHACVLAPPRGQGARASASGPAQLRLPGGRTPHEFLRTTPTGEREEVERFETIRPGAAVEIVDGAERVEVLAELDDRCSTVAWVNKLERYDHFLSGWAEQTERYAPRRRTLPVVVVLCRDRERARECARRADLVLCACRAYPGEYPASWDYRGRRSVLFVAERDVHEGQPFAWGVPALPPQVRAEGARPEAAAVVARTIPGTERRGEGAGASLRKGA